MNMEEKAQLDQTMQEELIRAALKVQPPGSNVLLCAGTINVQGTAT
jgi:hypothetical protein